MVSIIILVVSFLLVIHFESSYMPIYYMVLYITMIFKSDSDYGRCCTIEIFQSVCSSCFGLGGFLSTRTLNVASCIIVHIFTCISDKLVATCVKCLVFVMLWNFIHMLVLLYGVKTFLSHFYDDKSLLRVAPRVSRRAAPPRTQISSSSRT